MRNIQQPAARFFDGSVGPKLSVRSVPPLLVLTALVCMLFSLDCGTTAATLDLSAPPTAVAGSPFSVTVTVMIDGTRDTVINSHIHFTSSDPAAVLPSDYTFTPADAGSHTWTNGFTLMTRGDQTISAIIFHATGIKGSADVAVSP
jgi:hypothetical protein